MIQALVLLVLSGIGAALGWHFGRRPLRAPKRVLALTALGLLGVPVLLFVFANVLDSDALGWMAGLSLLAMLSSVPPVGAGVAVGWSLARRGATSRTHSNEPRTVSTSASRLSPADAAWTDKGGVLLAIAGVAAGFWVVLALGFRLHHQQAPGALDIGLIPAVVVLVSISAIGIRRVWRSRGSFVWTFSTAHVARGRSNAMAERKAWLVALAADPCRQRYAAMIEGGDVFWTPDRIEYDLDPQAATCCEHLAPIELAMRVAGVQVRMEAVGSVRAECRIGTEALEQDFVLPHCVSYEELQVYDRSLEDPPQALLRCEACSSRLWVLHPRVASPSTPVFPGTAN